MDPEATDLENLSHTEALELLKENPAFVYAAVVALRTSDDPSEKQRLRRVIAANVGDTASLRELLGADSAPLAGFYPDQTPSLTTDDTISSFIERFGGNQQTPEWIENIPEAPGPGTEQPTQPAGTAESAETTEAAEAAEPSEHTTEAVAPQKPADLTESFARIMIKNRNYTKALEIITELNLKNPEKSIYFADQMRFLRKLIALQSRRE